MNCHCVGTARPGFRCEELPGALPDSHGGPPGTYADGPTACVASPEVMQDIRSRVSAEHVLSTADARLATMAGMIDIPSVGKTGFNDSVIYEPSTDLGPALASAAGRQPSRRLAMSGLSTKTTLNCLVLLVDFPDNVGVRPASEFESLLFDPANANSMHSFYKEMSNGRLLVEGQVTGWIRASHPYDYYTNGQSGTGSSYPRNTPGLLAEILAKYCADNSLAPFDLNEDDYVDGLFLVHAGGGAEAERDTNKRKHMIWSHKWTLPTAFTDDGVKAYAYFTAPEDGRLGVFAHEFGHFIGLPDLYDTSYRSQGIGNWCLMAGGSWNGGGDEPARLSAWCLSTLGWIKPRNIRTSGAVSLDTLANDKSACVRLWSKGRTSKEYFLAENRQQTGRDARLPGHGLALWHIDESQSDNTNIYAYRVALVQADGRRDMENARNSGDAGDLFPGSRRVRTVDDRGASHPHTRKNDGTATGVRLSNIKETDGVITFNAAV